MLKWVASERGWVLPRDRDKTVKEANRARQWVYSSYTRRKLAVDVEECIVADTFCDNCNDCNNGYVGISLPEEMISTAGIWINGSAIQANSRWREFQDGQRRQCGKRLEATYTGISSPTERDISPCGNCSTVGFQAIAAEDTGKILTVSFKDQNNETQLNEIKLKAGEYVPTITPVKSFFQPAGITLPDNLCGGVIVAQMDTSRILSEYKPWQTKPSYRRLSLPGICCGQAVLVRGNRRFHDLYFNHETAEVDNELVVIEVVRYLQHLASLDPQGGHQQLAKFHEAEANKLMDGDQNRETGAGTVNRFQHTQRPRAVSSLRGSRR